MESRDQLRRRDVLDVGQYNVLRPLYRPLVARLREQRRVRLGDDAVALFENRETVLWQIHEVLRCEGYSAPRVARALSDYDAIIPRRGELRATVMIDGAQPGAGQPIANALLRPDGVGLSCGGLECPSVLAAAPVNLGDAVWYLCWRPSAAWIHALIHDHVPVRLHPRWAGHGAPVSVPGCLRQQLVDDVRGADRGMLPLLHRLAKSMVQGRRWPPFQQLH